MKTVAATMNMSAAAVCICAGIGTSGLSSEGIESI